MNSKYLQQGEPLYVETSKMMGGDFSTYQEFYNLSVQYLYGVINGIVSDGEVAGKLTSELYNDIYSAIYELTDPALFLVWAGNMATNKAFSYVCANRPDVVQYEDKTGNRVPGTDVPQSQPAPVSGAVVSAASGADVFEENGGIDEYISEFSYQDQEPFVPENFMQQQSVQNIVNERIATLPVLTRCIMQKYYYHDLPVSRIAYELNISPHRVAQELSRVKRMLKDVIASSYGSDYMNSVRVNSLAEVSIVWVAFAGLLGYATSAGTVAGAVAVGAAAGGVAAGAGGMSAGVGVAAGTGVMPVGAGMAAGAGGMSAGAGMAAGAGGMSAGAGVAAGAGGMSAGAGMAAGTGVMPVGAGMATSAAGTVGGSAVGTSAAGTTGAAVGSAAVKTGLGVGAKVAIGVAVTAAVAGGAAGVYTVMNKDDKTAESGIYAEVNNLPFSDETDGYTSPGYVTFTDSNGDEIQPDGVEIIQHNSETSIMDYTETVTDDGCRILSFTTQTQISIEVYDPYSEAGNLSVSLTGFDLFDYYTGLTLPTRDTHGNEKIGGDLNVENGDDGYDISYTMQTSWDWGDWSFSGDGHNSKDVTMYCYYEVTVTDGYDGLCLCYDKSGNDNKIEYDDSEEKASEELLESYDADDIICFRLDNLRESE